MVSGLSHMTFVVKNLDLAALFFEKVFDAQQIYSSGNNTFSLSKEKFLLVNDLWICIMEGDSRTERTYNHIAFQIDESEMATYESRIKSIGAEIKPGRPRVKGEGYSIYFYDFDNHLFELHAGSLDERLARYVDS